MGIVHILLDISLVEVFMAGVVSYEYYPGFRRFSLAIH